MMRDLISGRTDVEKLSQLPLVYHACGVVLSVAASVVSSTASEDLFDKGQKQGA